jgi:hypothetical protein
VATFAPARNRPASSATVVRVEEKKVVVALPSRKEIVLDLSRAASFDVARPRQIEISPGDKILIRANDKLLGLTNGQVLTISGIAPDGALQTKEGLYVPADFRQWCHGYIVTSHKAQGWTADHVVVAAERFTSKGAYVACSRGRRSCIVHTPDKARPMLIHPNGKWSLVLFDGDGGQNAFEACLEFKYGGTTIWHAGGVKDFANMQRVITVFRALSWARLDRGDPATEEDDKMVVVTDVKVY